MAKTLVGSSYYTGSASVANSDQFYYDLGVLVRYNNSETGANVVTQAAGVFSKMIIHVRANSCAAVSPVRFRKNGGDGNQNVNLSSSGTGDFEDTTNTDVIAVNDQHCVKLHHGASSGTITINMISYIFLADTDTVTFLSSILGQDITAASTTTYSNLQGEFDFSATEGNSKMRMRKAGTFRHLSVFTGTVRAQNSTLRLRKNGGNGNSNIVIGSGNANTLLVDNTNTDTVGAGEDWNFSISTGTGSDTLQLYNVMVEFVSTNGNGILAEGVNEPIAVTDGTTRYFQATGELVASSTETGATGVQTKAREAFTLSELTINVTQNDVGSNSNCRSRIGAANGNLNAVITANTPAMYSDSTNSDVLSATSMINFAVIVPSVSGTHTVSIVNISCYTYLAEETSEVDCTVTGKTVTNKFITHV